MTPGYEKLEAVFADAVAQAATGKGKERHAVDGVAFEDQLIVLIGLLLGSNHFELGQAIKKAVESTRLPAPRARAELLGAMNYLAAATVLLDRQAEPEWKPATLADVKEAMRTSPPTCARCASGIDVHDVNGMPLCLACDTNFCSRCGLASEGAVIDGKAICRTCISFLMAGTQLVAWPKNLAPGTRVVTAWDERGIVVADPCPDGFAGHDNDAFIVSVRLGDRDVVCRSVRQLTVASERNP